MSSIKKQVLVNGQVHFIEVNSSLDLDEVEVTGMDPISGKVVQVSLSPMLKPSQRPSDNLSFPMAPMAPPPAWSGLGEQTQQSPPSTPAPMDMFAENLPESRINPPLSYHAIPAPPNGLFNAGAAPGGEKSRPSRVADRT